ncbi:hypothetical protein AOLI_G00076480 [Acnodon oligacanthus]
MSSRSAPYSPFKKSLRSVCCSVSCGPASSGTMVTAQSQPQPTLRCELRGGESPPGCTAKRKLLSVTAKQRDGPLIPSSNWHKQKLFKWKRHALRAEMAGRLSYKWHRWLLDQHMETTSIPTLLHPLSRTARSKEADHMLESESGRVQGANTIVMLQMKDRVKTMSRAPLLTHTHTH